MPRRRTLWEEGRMPGPAVGGAATIAALAVVALNLVSAGRAGLFFDVAFVLVCLAAALAIRPLEFFVVGVLPPLLMGGTLGALAVVDRTAVAEKGDAFVQAVVSGLAHHATALLVGYALTLAVLGVRRIALAHAGRLRRRPLTRPVEERQRAAV